VLCVCWTARCGTPDSVPTSTSSTRGHILLATGRSGAPTHRESSPESLKLTWNFFARSRFCFCWRGYALRIPLTPRAMARRGQWLRHLRLLVRKNVKLQLRRPKGTVAEILMPTVFIVLLVAIRSLVPVGPPSLATILISLSCTRIPPPASPAACAS